MPINRTPWSALVDDDGSGLIGTIVNKDLIKTLLLDPIDALVLPYTVATSSTVAASTVTGAVNDWALGGAASVLIEWAGASDATFSGVAGGLTGATFAFKNTGTKVATFLHQNGLSAAGNRFYNVLTADGTPVAPGGWAVFKYDGGSWVLIGHEQGAAIPWTPTDASGAGLALTITQAGTYVLRGRHVTVAAAISYPVTASGLAAVVGGLPFTCKTGNDFSGSIGTSSFGSAFACLIARSNTKTTTFHNLSGGQLTNANLSGITTFYSGSYFT